MEAEFEAIRHLPHEAVSHTGSSAIRIVQRYDAETADVFDAWLAPDVARRWLFATASRPIAHVRIDARAGGTFRFCDRIFGRSVEYVGTYVTIARDRRLVFDLRMPEWQRTTRVAVELSSTETGCELALSHSNVPPDRIDEIEARWIGILFGLGETLDTICEYRRSDFVESASPPVEQGVGP